MWLLLTLACHPWTDGDYDGDGVRFPRDCDDGDARVHPGANDPVGDELDANCDGIDGVDADADGTASIGSGGTDCKDDDAEVHPLAVERCNGQDDNCDGTLDNVDAADAPAWYRDADLDGYGTALEVERTCYARDTDWVSADGDCDDTDASTHPGATEVCGADLACHGSVVPCAPLTGGLAASVTFTGPAPSSGTGWAVAEVGDVDGDGWPDLAVGARDLGQAWVLAGPFVQDRPVVSQAIVSLTGSIGAGVAVAGLGDVNDDQLADVLIGADGDQVGGFNAGAAWLVHGAALGVDTFSSAALQLIGEENNAFAGRSVAGPGDADGDGVPDLFIGAPGAGGGRGAAYLVSGTVDSNLNLGAADLKLEASQAGVAAGWSVAGGDMDGDGVSDLVVGGPMALEGRTWAVTGDPAGNPQRTVSLDLAEGQLRGEATGDQLGWALAIGDADGDGRADLWVSAPAADGERGEAWLILGNAAPGGGLAPVSAAAVGSVSGVTPGERLGESVAFVPDIDGDGKDELAIAGTGAATATVDDGSLWLFVGATVGAVVTDAATASMSGLHSSDGLGAGLAAGDLNQDGVGDLVIGVPGGGSDGRGPGEVLLIYGGVP